MTTNAPTVYIVDDDEAVREALGALLQSVSLRYQSFASGEAFLDVANPDMRGCLLLDVRMPGMSGLVLQQKLQELGVMLQIVIITGHGDVPLAVRAMRDGAFDFVEKPVHDEELNAVIEAAIASVKQEAAEPDEAARYFERVGRLTPREREVMDLVVEGRSSAAIGAILGVSHRTVDHHRARILEKMEVASIAGLIRAVLRSRQ